MSALRGVFAYPWVFWLMLVFPALALVQLIAAWRKHRLLARLGSQPALAALLPQHRRFRWLTPFLTTAAMTLVLVGAARPHWGSTNIPRLCRAATWWSFST